VSKIKTSRIQGRTDEGTLTIGSPTGGVTFEGDVVIPNYPTLDYIEDIVSGDIQVELNNYQRKDEKNQPQGYPGLDSNGQIALSQINLTPVEDDIADLRNKVNDNTAGVTENKQDIAKNASDITTKVSKAGDTMSGDLDMGGQRIKKVPQIPLEDTDAASKYYVDNASEVINHNVEINGSANSQQSILDIKNYNTTYFRFMGDRDIVMEGGQIKGCAEPTLDTDVANKYYVDNIGERGIQGPIRIDSDYVGTEEVVFGVYEELTREQAIEKGHDLEEGVPAEPRDGVPYSTFALFRVMGDGTIWGFNKIRGISSAPGANYDVTNMQYVDGKVGGVVEALEARIASLEAKLA